MRRESKSTTGSVVKDKRSKKWQFFWWADGQRHSKTLGHFPTKTAAWNAAQAFRAQPLQPKPTGAPTVVALVESYKTEKMPERYSTNRVYKLWLKNYIVPEWGNKAITELQPRPVEMWLSSLELSPKSRAHIRGMLHVLWDYAMWSGSVAVQVNPISLVTVKGSSKRTRQPRSLTVDEFGKFVKHLSEPFRTVALVCVCFGLRISECLGLKWCDVDWLEGKLRIERGIVKHRVDDVKTIYSQRKMSIDAEMMEVLKAWKVTTQFPSGEDWIFASPARLGTQPWCYDQVLRSFLKAGTNSAIGKLGTHTMRHTYRSWLDAVGTPIAVQQKLMRHADIRTTMNIYGDVVTDEMSVAAGKVTRLALNGTGTARRAS